LRGGIPLTGFYNQHPILLPKKLTPKGIYETGRAVETWLLPPS
jgi:hypothetical protein